MINIVRFEDIGTRDYMETWNYQESLLQEIVERKQRRDLSRPGKTIHHLLFVEHPHVYTLGKSGSENNLLLNRADLIEKGVTFHKTNRGGDITYHGPGQIVGYPVFDLEGFKLGLKDYIFKLEEAIIITCEAYGIKTERLPGATGVWVDSGKPGLNRKICAIGVRASHFVTMHGFALNVNTDLSWFRHINPCGYTDKGVTSIAMETGTAPDIDKVKLNLLDNLSRVFQFERNGI